MTTTTPGTTLTPRARQLAQWLSDIANVALGRALRVQAAVALYDDIGGGDGRISSPQDLCDFASACRRSLSREATHRDWLLAAGWLTELGVERLPERPRRAFVRPEDGRRRVLALVTPPARAHHQTAREADPW